MVNTITHLVIKFTQETATAAGALMLTLIPETLIPENKSKFDYNEVAKIFSFSY